MKEVLSHETVDRVSDAQRQLALLNMLRPVEACIAEGRRDMSIDKVLLNVFSEYAGASEAAYVPPKPVTHEAKASTCEVCMGIILVDSKARVGTTLVIEQKVADRGVVKSYRFVAVFRDVNDRM